MLCPQCGKEFEPSRDQKSSLKLGKIKNAYCSRGCTSQSLKKSVISECCHCGKAIEHSPLLNRKYCSRKCEVAGRPQRKQEVVCCSCGVPFTLSGTVKHRIKTGKQNKFFCSSDCYAKSKLKSLCHKGHNKTIKVSSNGKVSTICSICQNTNSNTWAINNQSKRKEMIQKWRVKNPNKVKAMKIKSDKRARDSASNSYVASLIGVTVTPANKQLLELKRQQIFCKRELKQIKQLIGG